MSKVPTLRTYMHEVSVICKSAALKPILIKQYVILHSSRRKNCFQHTPDKRTLRCYLHILAPTESDANEVVHFYKIYLSSAINENIQNQRQLCPSLTLYITQIST